MQKRADVAAGLGFVIVAAFVALLVVLAAPTLAAPGGNGKGKAYGHDKDHGGQGKADSSEDAPATEDDDQNDGGTPNNVADDGDDRHPSGRDRSVENGGSGNQGNSTSDPDDDGRGPDRSNGGPDKPDGSGGDDLADQDGNNGCGNDDDFEDDNEGWCGKPPEKEDDEVAGDEVPCDADAVMEGIQPCDVEDEEEADVEVEGAIAADVSDDVLGLRLDKSTTRPADDVEAATAAQGATETRGGLLPFTGTEGLMTLLAVAAVLVVTGIFLSKAHR